MSTASTTAVARPMSASRPGRDVRERPTADPGRNTARSSSTVANNRIAVPGRGLTPDLGHGVYAAGVSVVDVVARGAFVGDR